MRSMSMPSFMLLVITVTILALSALGCTSTPGVPNDCVSAGALAGPLDSVLRRHDTYVTNDPTLTETEKATYLRSSQLIEETVEQALRDPLTEAQSRPLGNPSPQ